MHSVFWNLNQLILQFILSINFLIRNCLLFLYISNSTKQQRLFSSSFMQETIIRNLLRGPTLLSKWKIAQVCGTPGQVVWILLSTVNLDIASSTLESFHSLESSSCFFFWLSQQTLLSLQRSNTSTSWLMYSCFSTLSSFWFQCHLSLLEQLSRSCRNQFCFGNKFYSYKCINILLW